MNEDWQAEELARLDDTFSAQLDSIKDAQNVAQVVLSQEIDNA